MKELMLKLKYEFKDEALLKKALTHRSFAVESHSEGVADNERLEFLGDAVLDLVVSDLLCTRYPLDQEGPLSHRRAALVSEGTLVEIAGELNLPELVFFGRSEKQSGGATKPRLISGALEAILGAIYMDGGFFAAHKVIQLLFNERIENQGIETDYRKDFKTRLQEAVQKNFAMTPLYNLDEEIGPPHDRVFKVSVQINGKSVGFGEGRSKKQAEQNAAEEALTGFNKKREIQ